MKKRYMRIVPCSPVVWTLWTRRRCYLKMPNDSIGYEFNYRVKYAYIRRHLRRQQLCAVERHPGLGLGKPMGGPGDRRLVVAAAIAGAARHAASFRNAPFGPYNYTTYYLCIRLPLGDR